MGKSEPIVKFFDNLWGPKAISLVWAREIHILKKYENHPLLSKIIEHEKKHLEFFDKYCEAESEWERSKLVYKNNIWDFFDCWKLLYYFDKTEFVISTISYSVMTTFLLHIFGSYLWRLLF